MKRKLWYETGMIMFLRWLLIIFVLAACSLSSTSVEETAVPTAANSVACDQMIETALKSADTACEGLSRNQACYGNRKVEVELQADTSAAFDTPGDLVDLLSIQRLTTFPFDPTAGIWGIAILKAQVNLPDTLPGQNVTFLLYGDAELEGVSPQMKGVVLRTGRELPGCNDAPLSAALVQSPDGNQVTMNINGASLILGSTVYLTAAESQEFTLATIKGSAMISAFDTTRVVQPGTMVTMPLGGTNGLQVVGPPSEPRNFNTALVERAPLTLLEPVSPTPTPSPAGVSTSSAPQTVQLTPTSCAPRADWTATYTVQRGDTLFTIAQRYGISLDELQQANCIADPNRLSVGTVLRVPFQQLNPTPPSAGTPTPSTAVLRADKTLVKPGECALISWEVYNVSQVYFEGQTVKNVDRQQVCPTTSTTYTLLVMHPDGAQVPYTVRIEVTLPLDQNPAPTLAPSGP